jgi:alpha/beta superfamily hydrolase
MKTVPTQEANRVDRARGIRETAAFIGASGDQVYVSLSEPVGEARGGVLVCPSLHAEMSSNYRREVLLARRLAENGIAALRFHYRGSGHSDRDSGFETTGSMCDDALASLTALRQRVGGVPLGVLGTRIGAVVAIDCVAQVQAPLVLWEPVLNGSRYLRETFRKRAFREIAIGKDRPTSSADLESELRERGLIDVLGYPISSAFHDSFSPMRLAEHVADAVPRPLLVLEIGKAGHVRQEYARLVDGLNAAGWRAQAELAIGSEAWWFAGEGWETEEDQPLTKSLLGRTSSWFIERFDPGSAA